MTPADYIKMIDDATVYDVAIVTPLDYAAKLSGRIGHEILMKREDLQPVFSFKLRGAYNKISSLSNDELSRGVICSSAGNHAQGVALAANRKGVRAVVVMPTTAPPVKVDGSRRLGAEIVFEGTTSVERKLRAETIQREDGLAMVPPFDHQWIIAGQGTVGLEIVEEFEFVDVVVAPIGGGGLCSGCAAAVRRLRPDTRIVGVEPEGAASMRAALDAGEPVQLSRIDTIADGLAPVRAGELTLEHVQELVDEVVTVDDDAIREATSLLVYGHKLVAEYSGAATVAALRSGRLGDLEGRKVALLVSGGNLDPSLLRELD